MWSWSFLRSIIDNSIKYSGESVEIGITVEETLKADKPFYKICVEDNGYGVPDEKKQVIFGRLERAAKKEAGKGLGLHIVRSLVEKYRGEVCVEDRVKGNYKMGARFCFTMPKAGEGKE